MDYDVEVAPIYRHRDKVEEPIRPHKYHGLSNEQEVAKLESHCKQPALAKGVPKTGLLAFKAKIPGIHYYKWLVVRLRL